MAPIVRPMRPLLVLMRAALGGGVERRILPVAGVTFIYSASFSTFWVYVGIYAVKGLHWPASRVGLLFLASAPAAAVANYLSGRISDRTGRKPLIVVSFLASSANLLLLAWLGGTTALAFMLIVVQGVIGAPAYSLDRVLVADLVHDDESREPAYASVRVATNLGTLVGPPLGALLVFVAGWTAFLLGISALGVVGAAFAIALLPPAHAIAEAREPGSLRAVVRDRPFSLLLLSTLLAFTDYCGFETVLPVLAVSAYGLAPSTWGLLVVISPALVVLAQLRLSRRRGGRAGRRQLASRDERRELGAGRVVPREQVEEHEPVAQKARHQEVPPHELLPAQRPLARRERIAKDLEARLRALLGRIDEPAGLTVLDLGDDAAHATRDRRPRLPERLRTGEPEALADRLLDHGRRVHLEGG